MVSARLPPARGTASPWRNRPIGSVALIAGGRRHGTSRRRYSEGTPDDVDRPLLDLGINAAEILANDAYTEQLDAAEEEYADQQRGVARHVDAEDQRLRDDNQPVEERQERYRRADIGPDLERCAGE